MSKSLFKDGYISIFLFRLHFMMFCFDITTTTTATVILNNFSRWNTHLLPNTTPNNTPLGIFCLPTTIRKRTERQRCHRWNRWPKRPAKPTRQRAAID